MPSFESKQHEIMNTKDERKKSYNKKKLKSFDISDQNSYSYNNPE